MPVLDWHSIASLLADSIDRPVFALTANGTVELWNAAAERRLGWARADVVGKRWSRTFADGEDIDVSSFLGLALRGGIKQWLLRGRTAAGDRIVMDLAVSATGASGEVGGALVCTVQDLKREDAAGARTERAYEISTRDEDFGLITHVGRGGTVEDLGRRCYDVIAGRDRRCADCALGQRDVDTRVSVMTAVDGTIYLSRAARIDDRRARITYEVMEPAVVRRLLSTRLSALAARNLLSQRELEVLNHLVVGRDLHEIAAELDITPRTVRFHQGNLLRKLRIESRLELLRLLFE
jgi:PAS domain S-box-containing protein